MESGQRPFILRDPRYPDGWVLVVAWDYEVANKRTTSRLLCRTSDDNFVVHVSIDDGVVNDEVIMVDRDEALQIYEHMPIHFAPLRPLSPGADDDLDLDHGDLAP